MGYLGYLVYLLDQQSEFPYALIRSSPLVFVLIAGITLFLDRVSFLADFLEKLSAQLEIFLYIYVPLSLISVAVVLIRNLQ